MFSQQTSTHLVSPSNQPSTLLRQIVLVRVYTNIDLAKSSGQFIYGTNQLQKIDQTLQSKKTRI